MKKKSLFIILLIIFCGLFIPRGVYAVEFMYRPAAIDYRFFVEDENENDIGNLQFRLHDKYNSISFESQYDPNTKAYYFIEPPDSTPSHSFEEFISHFRTLDSRVLPDGLVDDLTDSVVISNYGYNYFNLEVVNQFINKYPSFEVNSDGNILLIGYIPLIFEEVDDITTNPIKKIVFGHLQIIPSSYPDGSYYFQCMLMIVNNTCSMDYSANMSEDFLKKELYPFISLTRNNAYDYTDEVMNRFSSGSFASSEINSDNYLNKEFNSGRFATSEVSSPDSSANQTTSPVSYYSSNKNLGDGTVSVIRLRTQADNIPENVFKDYCDCLPVFVQQRKTKSIVDVITNPITYRSGVFILIVSLLVVIGFVILVLRKKV